MMNKAVLGIYMIVFLASCGTGRRLRTELPEISISANDKKDLYRESAPRLWDITYSRIDLSFNWKEKTANGKVWIDLHPYFYEQDSIVLDAKGMKIEVVQQASLNDKTLNYMYANDQLRIKLDKKYKNSENVRLYIKYVAMPYAEVSGGSAAIADDRGLYFINTDGAIANKPQQIWTQGETESNSHWLPTIDKPNERFVFTLELTVPDTMQTLSNGQMTGSEKAGNGLRTDKWEMDQPIQPYAIMFAIGKYAIIEDSWMGKPVNYYVEPEYAGSAKGIFNNTTAMMSYFSEITGVPYPWNKYSQIVVRDYVSGAMENTTATLFGEFMNENERELIDKNFEDIVSHELFHQWFGDYVTSESWSNLTLSESFATYGEQLWRKHKYGKESADKLAYEDLGIYLNSGIYAPHLVRFHYSDREDMFDRISYQKGGAILHYLHSLMGDAAFFRAMNIYLGKNALSPAEATQWRLAVEEATGKDWNWFFNQFYYHGGHPQLDINYEYDDVLKELFVTVKQLPADSSFAYMLPIKTALIYGSEKSITDWNINKKKEIFRYPYKNGVKPLIVPDIEHCLPGTIKESKTPAEWLEQMKLTDDYTSKRIAITEALKYKNDANANQVIDLALADSSSQIKAFALEHIIDWTGDEYVKRWQETVKGFASGHKSNDVRAAAIRIAGRWKLTALKEELLSAVNSNSYKIAGAALKSLNRIDDDSAYAKAREILQQSPRAELREAAESIIAIKGDIADFAYFEENADHVYGSRKMAFATVFTAYLSQVKDLVAFDKGLDILTRMAKEESIKSYRSYIVQTIIYSAESYKTKGLDNGIKLNKIKKKAEELSASEKDAENKGEYQMAIAKVFGKKK